MKCEKVDDFKWDESFIGQSRTCFMNETTSIDSTGVRNRTPKDDNTRGIVFDHNKKIEYLPDGSALSFPGLVGFSADNCAIKSVSYDNFKFMDKLLYLNLRRNRIEKIDQDSFSDLTSLMQLVLSEKR